MLREAGSEFTDKQMLLLIQKHNGHGCTIKKLLEIAVKEMPRYFSFKTDEEHKRLYFKVVNSINRLEDDRKIRTEMVLEGKARLRKVYLERSNL